MLNISVSHREDFKKLLNDAVLLLRKDRPRTDIPYTTHFQSRMFQIWINTPACRFSVAGNCTICNYWDGNRVKKSLDGVCKSIEKNSDFEIFLLNTCGSCLCDEELPFDFLKKIMKCIEATSVKKVILETHLIYADINKIRDIKKLIPDKELFIEYGQESTNRDVLEYCLNKPILSNQQQIIKKINNERVGVIANVVLGAPFLSVKERIQDAVDSIRDLLRSGINSIVLFPVNIKEYTLVRLLYDHGYYKRVNAAEIIEVLKMFSADELARIEIAWFEPRYIRNEECDEVEIGPLFGDRYGNILKRLLEYESSSDGQQRKLIIDDAGRQIYKCIDKLYEYPYPDIAMSYQFLKDYLRRGQDAFS